jgi:ATP-dependent protease HslVU (ClpYQ) peptidase subunit
MTVIVWDGKILAADSRMTEGSFLVTDNDQKLFILDPAIEYKGDELLACALAGSSTDNEFILEHICGHDFPSKISHKASGIFIGKKNVYILENDTTYLIPFSRNTKLAEGSGCQFAYSAMKLGLNAIEAAKHACKLDMACGGKIRCKEL